MAGILLNTSDKCRRQGRYDRFDPFKNNYLPDGRVSGTVDTVEKLCVCWETAALKGVPPLVINCSCFQV